MLLVWKQLDKNGYVCIRYTNRNHVISSKFYWRLLSKEFNKMGKLSWSGYSNTIFRKKIVFSTWYAKKWELIYWTDNTIANHYLTSFIISRVYIHTVWVWWKSVSMYTYPLQWRHDEGHSVSNQEISKLSVIRLCVRDPRVTGGFPSKRASNGENFSIWRRHHVFSYP